MKIYYRGSNNPHEPNLLASGKIKYSVNHLNGKKEIGLSVVEKPEDLNEKFSIICKVIGDELLERGSDGEILLDVNTVRLLFR